MIEPHHDNDNEPDDDWRYRRPRVPPEKVPPELRTGMVAGIVIFAIAIAIAAVAWIVREPLSRVDPLSCEPRRETD